MPALLGVSCNVYADSNIYIAGNDTNDSGGVQLMVSSGISSVDKGRFAWQPFLSKDCLQDRGELRMRMLAYSQAAEHVVEASLLSAFLIANYV